MATDSTELTFVRCPSCRSLVPAVSTRCRMCGAGLEGVAKPAPQAEAKVVEPASEEFVFNDSIGINSGGADLDPLSAYIEEVSDNKPAVADIADPAESTTDFDWNASPRDLPLNALSSDEDPLDIFASPAAASKPAAPVKPPVTAKPAAPAAPAPKADKPAPNSDFKSRWAKRTQVSEQDDVEELEVQAPKAPSKPVPRAPLAPRQAEVAPQAAPAPVVAQPPKAKPQVRVEKAIPESPLFGFMVSYENPNGSALELREGKFLVTASSLKENDLVIDHPSISTPHALFNAVAGHTLLAQDLVSETGVFVKVAGSSEYERIEQSVNLQSGDWIKLGDLEYLLVLIPS